MTLLEAAALLGVTPDNLRGAIARGALRATKIGRDWQVEPWAVALYRRNHQQRSTPFLGMSYPVRLLIVLQQTGEVTWTAEADTSNGVGIMGTGSTPEEALAALRDNVTTHAEPWVDIDVPGGEAELTPAEMGIE